LRNQDIGNKKMRYNDFKWIYIAILFKF